MKYLRFFSVTVKGDNLRPEEIRDKINLPCKIFHKGEDFVKDYLPNKSIKQKSNRWLYISQQVSTQNNSKFLTENLLKIYEVLNELQFYIDNFETKMELRIYAEDKTDICLTKKQIMLLNKIGLKLYISFC